MLRVSSAGVQPRVAGLYERQPADYNGRPVYVNPSSNVRLHFVETQWRFWLFGSKADAIGDDRRGYALSREDVPTPADVRAWRAYDDAAGNWTDDDTISVKCDCTSEYLFLFIYYYYFFFFFFFFNIIFIQGNTIQK